MKSFFPPITLIVPNYNGAHLLERNLPSARAATADYAGNAKILIVDDGSTDGSTTLLQQKFPDIRCVAHQTNQGFSEAILTGVRSASTDLVFLLNSDVELNVGCLEMLVPYFQGTETFSVSPLILGEDGSVQRHSWNLRKLRHGHLVIDDWTLADARKMREHTLLSSLYCSGGSMLVDRRKFLLLGGFHPIFKPFYGEDFDLGIRAWYRGWPSYFEPNASLVHQSQGSIKDAFKRGVVKTIRRRNRYLLEWIHLPLSNLIGASAFFTLVQLAGELLIGDAVNLRGFWTALPKLSEAIAARRQNRADRELVFNEVLARLSVAK